MDVVGREAVIEGQASHPLAQAYADHSDSVRRAAFSVVRDSDLAEDVTQDVFLAMWARPDRFDPERGSFESLLRVMAKSRALDAARRRSAAGRARDRLEGRAPGAQAPDPAEVVVDAFRGRELRVAVRDLPAEQRESISLAYWGQMSSAEVAAAHGVPVGTAKSRIRIGLTKLRRDFAA